VLAHATDVSSTLLFISHPILVNRLTTSTLLCFVITEDSEKHTVQPFMKTEHIFGLAIVVAVTGFAASAQAGWALNFSFGLPVPLPTPVVVAPPPCLPPVVTCPPSVVCRPLPAPCRPVVYVTPSYVRCYDYRGNGQYHGQGGWGRENRSHNRGGHR
jgi:hypothetical protein